MDTCREDSAIWLRLIDRHGVGIHGVMNASAAEKSAWRDFSTMQTIERVKAETRAKLLRYRVFGYWGSHETLDKP